jgi:hypothetical protein
LGYFPENQTVRIMGLSDYPKSVPFGPSPSKPDSPGRGTVTNQELVQPHAVDACFCRAFMWLCCCAFCALAFSGQAGVSWTAHNSSADRNNKGFVMGLYFRGGANPIYVVPIGIGGLDVGKIYLGI